MLRCRGGVERQDVPHSDAHHRQGNTVQDGDGYGGVQKPYATGTRGDILQQLQLPYDGSNAGE
jgi:hypothetical protein